MSFERFCLVAGLEGARRNDGADQPRRRAANPNLPREGAVRSTFFPAALAPTAVPRSSHQPPKPRAISRSRLYRRLDSAVAFCRSTVTRARTGGWPGTPFRRLHCGPEHGFAPGSVLTARIGTTLVWVHIAAGPMLPSIQGATRGAETATPFTRLEGWLVEMAGRADVAVDPGAIRQRRRGR